MILKNFCPFCLISGNLTVMTSENDPDDPLARFALARCESAFRTLVEQHTGMVHAVARRMLQGNEVQAREVTQTVFVELARRAATLPRGVVLGAWLHRVACNQAALLIRAEVRRRQREATAATMNESVPDETAWAGIAPVIDAELERLPAADREALVLRFFENRPLRDVGTALGTTEEAARKRVTRALEKLRARFRPLGNHHARCGGAGGAHKRAFDPGGRPGLDRRRNKSRAFRAGLRSARHHRRRGGRCFAENGRRPRRGLTEFYHRSC